MPLQFSGRMWLFAAQARGGSVEGELAAAGAVLVGVQRAICRGESEAQVLRPALLSNSIHRQLYQAGIDPRWGVPRRWGECTLPS